MHTAWRCPRCGAPVRQLSDERFWCWADGAVAAVAEIEEPTVSVLLRHVADTAFPTWLPWPLPAQWSVSGVARAGHPQVQATVLACTAPDPLGGLADVLIVCEEAGVGLGARYAGARGLDVGREISGSPATTTLPVDGHTTPLWWISGGPDRDVYVGEASGCWLWLVAWPASAGALISQDLALVDLHDLLGQLEIVPLGGLSARLAD